MSAETAAVMPAPATSHDSEARQDAPADRRFFRVAARTPRLEIGRRAGPEAGSLLVQEAGGGQVLGRQAERLEHGELVVVRAPGGGAGEQLAEFGPDRVSHAVPLGEQEVSRLAADR